MEIYAGFDDAYNYECSTKYDTMYTFNLVVVEQRYGASP